MLPPNPTALQLPPNNRPPLNAAFSTIGHAGASLVRVDVTPDGRVSVAAREANSPYVSLDGIRFATTDVGWTYFRPTSISRANGGDWTIPQWRLVGNRVELRGLVRKATGNYRGPGREDSVGGVPRSIAPRTDVFFTSTAHSGGKAHRIKFMTSGDIKTACGTGDSRYVSLDGMSYYIAGTDDVNLELALMAPFAAAVTADGYAPPAVERRTVTLQTEAGDTVGGFCVALRGRLTMQGKGGREKEKTKRKVFVLLCVWAPCLCTRLFSFAFFDLTHALMRLGHCYLLSLFCQHTRFRRTPPRLHSPSPPQASSRESRPRQRAPSLAFCPPECGPRPK